MKKKLVGNLPETSDEEFWGKDAEQIIGNEPKKIETKQDHLFRQRGNVAVCTSCQFSHAVFLDSRTQEVRGGKIVKKKPTGKTGGQ